MESIRRLLFIQLMFCMAFAVQAQLNLSALPEQERDSMLVEVAKHTFQKQMPKFYREYGTPTIERHVFQKNPSFYDVAKWGSVIGKGYYRVTFPYDPIREAQVFVGEFAARVYIMEDNGKAYLIDYGNWDWETYSEYLFRDW